MVLLLRRELLILRAIALLVLAAACGGGGAPEENERQTDARAPEISSGALENGDPMPPAAENGGVPPYPGAIVWTVAPRPPSEFHTVQAFTPDPFLEVVAFYDEALSGWRRTVAEDAVHYHLDPNRASVIVAPWSGELMGEEGPEPLRPTRTSIGIAWKEGP